jgi:acetylornithine/N-succinyldiaminopimelate aminotransferase
MEAKNEDDLLSLADRHLLGNYRPARFIMDSGQGCRLYDTQGREYLDFCAGVAVCGLGHSHPDLVRVIAEQAGKVMHVSNYFYNRQNVLLAAELCAATGFDRAFFCNSGAEANEALLKIARRHHFRLGKPRSRIIAFEKAFHGRTMGALALTGNAKYLEGFEPHVGGIEHVPFGDGAALRAAMGSDVAAVIAEPLQGEGGVNLPPDGFMALLREVCDEHGALLLLDEVQVGMGRTGKMLGGEHSGVRADAISLAKGLGGGFPIGAMLLRETLADSLPPGTHGSTFGGNPLASAAARCVLSVLERDGLVERAAAMGEKLSVGLREVAARHPNVCTGERGLGLLRAITLVDGIAARDLLPIARDNGLLCTAAGPSALRFTPPFIVSQEEIDEAMERTSKTLASVESSL